MKTSSSTALYRRASRVMAGGVSSPVRAFKAVGGDPLFIQRGKGSRIWDADGNEYVDYVLSWGPLILGHANPAVTRAIVGIAKLGTSFGAPSLPELELAEEITKSVPSIEMVRFVNSGTEATMSALRLSRAFTGRKTVLKFEGCYHGHADPFLSDAGSGLATFGIPSSPGVPEEVSSATVTVPFNDVDAAKGAAEDAGDNLAAVIVEPVAGNMGVVPPAPEFLKSLRKLTKDLGAVLIFDEVITGFRVSRGGAQAVYGVVPDLTCLGKIIGGGLPVGAYGGSAEIMRLVAPEGKMYQAGTLSGNPLAMSAGLTTLQKLDPSAYRQLERMSESLGRAMKRAAARNGVPLTINRVGSMLGIFFSGNPVTNFKEARDSGHARYPAFHRSMLKSGVYLAPSPFETTFLSTSHSDRDIEVTRSAAEVALESAP